jgi:hypothetical protein
VTVASTGRDVTGKFRGYSESQLVVDAGGGRQQLLPFDDITRVRWTPQMTGRQLLAGLLGGVVAFGITRAAQKRRTDAPVYVAVLVGGAAGAAFTAEETVYERPAGGGLGPAACRGQRAPWQTRAVFRHGSGGTRSASLT